MNFEPNETQALVRKTARDFAQRQLAPGAAGRDRDGTFPEAEMRTLGALGLLGVCVPEDDGGVEAGPVALALALEEIAQADASVAVTMAVTNMVGEILARYGGEDLRRRLLPGLCAGDAVAGAFALSEPQSGSDAAAMRTTARRVDGGYVLRGTKLWTTSGDHAGVLVVMARHEDSRATAGVPMDDGGADRRPGRPIISAFVLERGARGLTAGRPERKMGQHGSSTVPLTLDDVFVPQAALLGQEGEGLKIALAALDGGRISVAAQAVGIGRAALDAAVTYARQRRQFDRPIASFQAVRFMLADAALELEAARLLMLQAAWGKERGAPVTRLAAQAKLLATERTVEICDRAIQVHGGYGYTRDFPVERYFRDARVTTLYEGTSQIQRVVIAREILRQQEGRHA
jgi:alkylation response protein AidB-like acyl-CoA dehydrogenase